MLTLQKFLLASAIVLTTTQCTPEEDRLRRVFDPEMLSVDLAYFEQTTGIARNTYVNKKLYKMGDCMVTAYISDGSVRALRLDMSKKCTFDLNEFLHNYKGNFPAPHVMTFGQFDAITGGGGRFFADCLSSCGNAADPIVYELWEGSNADMALEVMLEVVQAGDPALAAADKWQAAMEREEEEDWIMYAKFNCSRTKYDQVAHQVFRDVKISAITVGYNIEPPSCEQQ